MTPTIVQLKMYFFSAFTKSLSVFIQCVVLTKQACFPNKYEYMSLMLSCVAKPRGFVGNNQMLAELRFSFSNIFVFFLRISKKQQKYLN